ncbi:hypothetical protein Maes01_01798 [Microbulbifer aestuariivivens]|uniref:GST C-terminal domain-containing protein n=1 Tax=Microbulbifer aestuariivivens TaxID=1908308 RepID=A0ABP9WSK1_9GAMM
MDYKLFYWDLPFRGNFVQLMLEEVGARYQRRHASEIYPEHGLAIHNPGMAPPYLYECRSQTYFAQMPACLMHLGREYDRLPAPSELHTLALKTILDCNDVLKEITNNNGLLMWQKEPWEQFRSQRLRRWMQVFEHTGLAHGLKSGDGFLLGSQLSVADIAVTALFGTLLHCLPPLREDLLAAAPGIAGLCERIEARPAIRTFLQKQRGEYGSRYCGGQIEDSLRQMLG